MVALEITPIGNALGQILPEDMQARLKLVKGDGLFVTDTPDGVVVTPYSPEAAERLALRSGFMREARNTRCELAK
jgi:antitoxin component of MazEF toxin-antitoxin module